MTGSQQVRVYGTNLDSADFKCFFNGVQYTALERGDGYIGFILGSNGNAQLVLNGELYMSFSVTGNVMPAELTLLRSMRKLPDANASFNDGIEAETVQSECINYPHKVSDGYPIFGLAAQFEDEPSIDDFDFINCTRERDTWSSTTNYKFAFVSIDDAEQPAYISYKGFIIAVFNYLNN